MLDIKEAQKLKIEFKNLQVQIDVTRLIIIFGFVCKFIIKILFL